MPRFLDIFPNPVGFAALALAIPIVIVHFLKFQPPVLVVPSIRFWRAELAEPVANRFWQRIKDPISLLLQLLALLLLSAALAGAQIPNLAAPPRSVVFALDVSASMLATDQGVSRFERARAYLERTASDAGALDQFGLVTLGAEVRVVLPPGTNGSALAAAVRELRPTFEAEVPQVWPGELRQLWQAARERSAVVLLTGPVEDELMDQLSGEIGVLTFGAPLPNRGVIFAEPRFDRGSAAATGEWIIEVAVADHRPSAGAANEDVSGPPPLLLDRFDPATGRFQLRDARPGVSGMTEFSVGAPGEAVGLWRIRFERGDGMGADDGVVVRIAQPPSFTVPVVGAPGVSEYEVAKRAAESSGTEAPGREYQLARLLQVYGASGTEHPIKIGSVTVTKGAGSSNQPHHLTYARDSWWDDLALESLLIPAAAGLELGRDWEPLLSVAGLPVAARRQSSGGSTSLTLSSGLLESAEFLASDTFLTLIGRWVKESLRTKGVVDSGPVASIAMPSGETVATPFVLSASESAQVSGGKSLQRAGAAPLLPPAQDPWPLGAWLGLLALALVGLDWWRYARRHGRRRRSESQALAA